MIPRLRLPARIGSQVALLVVGIIALLYLILAVALVLLAPRNRPGPPASDGAGEGVTWKPLPRRCAMPSASG